MNRIATTDQRCTVISVNRFTSAIHPEHSRLVNSKQTYILVWPKQFPIFSIVKFMVSANIAKPFLEHSLLHDSLVKGVTQFRFLASSYGRVPHRSRVGCFMSSTSKSSKYENYSATITTLT